MSLQHQLFYQHSAANVAPQHHFVGGQASWLQPNQPINAIDWGAVLDATREAQLPSLNNEFPITVIPSSSNTQISGMTEQELSAYITQEAQQWQANTASPLRPEIEQEPAPVALHTPPPPPPPLAQNSSLPYYQPESQASLFSPNTLGQPNNISPDYTVARPPPMNTFASLDGSQYPNGYWQARRGVQNLQTIRPQISPSHPSYAPSPRRNGWPHDRMQPPGRFMYLPHTQSISAPPTPLPQPSYLQPMPSANQQIIPSSSSLGSAVKHERCDWSILQWRPSLSPEFLTQVDGAPIAGPSRRPPNYRTISAPNHLPQRLPSTMNSQNASFGPIASLPLQQNNVKSEQYDHPLQWQSSPSEFVGSFTQENSVSLAGPSRTRKSKRNRIPPYERPARSASRSKVDPFQPMTCKLRKMGGAPTEICDAPFNNGVEMMKHIGKRGTHGILNDKHDPEPFHCSWEDCGQNLTGSGGLLRHIREVHAGMPREKKASETTI